MDLSSPPLLESAPALEEALATYSTNPESARAVIRQLQADDPTRFAQAAARLISSKSGDALIDLLLDENALPADTAVFIARDNLAAVHQQLDARLIRKILEKAKGDVKAISATAALRLLRLVEAVSDCSRLSSYFVQFMRHPSPEVRSKVVLMWGRVNLNLPRIEAFLESGDARVRANAIESLWGHPSAAVWKVLRQAAKDPSVRTSVNALLALCRRGDRDAFESLRALTNSEVPLQRAGAAWAIGECGDLALAPLLDKLAEDEDVKVRAMAERGRDRLRLIGEAPPAGETSPEP